MSNKVRKFIVEFQRKNNIPIWHMCNVLNISETDWEKFANSYGISLTTFQKIMFIEAFNTPLPM